MPIKLTPAKFSNAAAPSTRPVRLVRWEHSGALELLSCSGDITYNGEIFTAGGVNVLSVEDGRRATLSLPATPERVQEVINGNWRNGKICQIYAVPGLPADDGVYELEEGLLELDGIIDSSQYSGGTITINAVHKYLKGNLTPRTTFNAFSVHILPAGTVIEWEGQSYTLVSRR